MHRLIFVVIFCLVMWDADARAQGCCTPGTSSLGGIERGVVSHQTLAFSLNYQYNYLGKTYAGTQPVDDVRSTSASVSYLNIEVEYGFAERVSFVVIGNYSVKAREFTTKSVSGSEVETTEITGRGLGDVLFIGKYQLLVPTFSFPVELSLGGGAKAPVGSYTREQDGVRLSLDLQPGSGAVDLFAWLYTSMAFPFQGVAVFANLLHRYTGTNPDGYRIGNEWLPTLGISYTLVEWFELSLLARGRIAERDFAEGRFLPSTGGQIYSIQPVILYRQGNVQVRVYGQIPVHRNFIGTQLSLSNGVGADFQMFFDI
jgi:hypothetical protein